MEEMRTLLARRRRIAEKVSTIETEQKEDRSEDAESITYKAPSTSTPKPNRKPWERTNKMKGSNSPVISKPNPHLRHSCMPMEFRQKDLPMAG